ncbi:response regulator [Salinispora vitiensis]|uniref:response regulator n=1 Tax=Salinispora vitiensis TaxID=999544 RepID=UPI000377453D|nr:response regulator transcription factor [Salinispora vitiensis]
MSVRVVLADDQPLVRAALEMVIAETDDVEVVGEAGTGEEAVRLAEELRPDVVVMDIRMPGMDGIEATRLVTTGPCGSNVVVLTTFDDDAYVYGALRAGASGFLVKDMALDDILAAVRVVAAGDALIAPSVTRRLIADFTAHPEPACPDTAHPGSTRPESTRRGPPLRESARPRPPHAEPARPRRSLEGITDRERELLTLVGRGLSNAEIAADMSISTATVKTYVTRLLAKLDARNRVHLVILAYEEGLVRTSGPRRSSCRLAPDRWPEE